MKKIGLFCLLVPFVISTLSIQNFVTKFGSESYGQSLAYFNVILVIVGIIILFKDRGPFTKIINLWLLFFAFYLVIGTIASYIHDVPISFLKALIPFIYFLGFSIFLSMQNHEKIFFKTAAVAFLISSTLVIILQRLNFSMDISGIYKYEIERAGGVYGDANQAAVVSILAFIFAYYAFTPETKFLKFIKFMVLIIPIYALLLTFSKTGFVIFLIVLGLTFHKMFTPKRLLISFVVIPLILAAALNAALNSDKLSLVQKDRIENVANLITLNTDKVEFSSRDVLLKNMLNYVYDNPVIGNGISFSNSISGHNTIIGVWADAGIITFFIFLCILFKYFQTAWNAPSRKRYFGLSVIFLLTLFMLSLQSIINQPYLIAVFAFLGYYLERNEFPSEYS